MRKCSHCQTEIIRNERERQEHFIKRQTCGAIACVTKQRIITQRKNTEARGYTTNAPIDRENWWTPKHPEFPLCSQPFAAHNLRERRQPPLRNLLPTTNNPRTKSGIADL